MLRTEVRRRLLCVGVAVTLVLGGCASADPSSASTPATSPEASLTATPAATPAATPTPTVAPSLNNLTGEQILTITAQCGGVGEVTSTDVPLAKVSQWAADDLVFYAATAECAQLPAIVALDVAGTDPEGAQFSSPLRFIEPPCADGTVVSFWAHYDDDLIFANPALQQAFDDAQCLRTVFFTESDAGKGNSSYAAGREAGIRAAYDVVRGSSGPWVDRSVSLRSGVTLTLTRPEGDDRVSLLFLRLPDGGVNGAGYEGTGMESLPKLVTGEIAALHSLETGEEITLAELESTVTEIVDGYSANRVLAHLPGFAQGSNGDHSDHRAVGRIVAAPVDQGLIDPGIVQYAQGYPVAKRPKNIDPGPLARKLRSFSTYAAKDPVIACHDPAGCLKIANFGEWVQRQYLVDHAHLDRE